MKQYDYCYTNTDGLLRLVGLFTDRRTWADGHPGQFPLHFKIFTSHSTQNKVGHFAETFFPAKLLATEETKTNTTRANIHPQYKRYYNT